MTTNITFVHQHPDKPEHKHTSAVEMAECDAMLDFAHTVKLELLDEYAEGERNSLPTGAAFDAEVDRRWWQRHEHAARIDDRNDGDFCRDCGVRVTWVGPSPNDWEHADDIWGAEYQVKIALTKVRTLRRMVGNAHWPRLVERDFDEVIERLERAIR